MRHSAMLVTFCVAAAFLAGCNSFHTSFRTSFKASFMKSCTAQPGATEPLCGCVEATLERRYSDQQLIAMTAHDEALAEVARACAASKTHARTVAAAHSTAGPAAIDPTRIDAFVTPYYVSKGPVIDVGRFSSGLASHNESTVVATIEQMKAHWQQLSFPQLYVGAIRLYDLGYRSEAVYWFYTAQYRGRLVGTLLDPAKIGSIGDPGFELKSAGVAFMQTAGTWINGYAFGNPDGLVTILQRVQKEGRRIPPLQAVYPNVVFVPQRRWAAANTGLAAGMNSLIAYLESQKDEIKAQRVEHGIEAEFSQLTNKELPPK